MKNQHELLSEKLHNYLSYQHIGLCIFVEEDFFNNSPLSLALKFLLNWQNSFSEKFDSNLNHALYISNLYDRTFPVIFSKDKIKNIDFEKELKNYSQLILGLSVQDDGESKQLDNSKILIIIDQNLEKTTFDQIEKKVHGIASCDLFHWKIKSP